MRIANDYRRRGGSPINNEALKRILAIANAVEKCGIPKEIYIDDGNDTPFFHTDVKASLKKC